MDPEAKEREDHAMVLSEQRVVDSVGLGSGDFAWLTNNFPHEMSALRVGSEQAPTYRPETINFARSITTMRGQGASAEQIKGWYGLGCVYAPAREAKKDENSTSPSLLEDQHYTGTDVSGAIAASLFSQWTSEDRGDKHIPIFVNVGATSSTGDSLGPFVGWFLKRKGFMGEYLGDLDEPVHATNLKEKVNEAWLKAMKQNKFPYIIAVDAAVGRPGRITVNRGPLRPGAGMGKSLPQVGSVHIMGGTAHFPFMIWFTGLDQTVGMAEVIADGLIDFHSRWQQAV